MGTENGPAIAQRFKFDMESDSIVPRNPDNLPMALQRMEIIKEGNTLTANVPALATGASSYAVAVPDGDGWSSAGRWDSVAQRGDPKYQIKQALEWWKIDPIVFKCCDLLAKWANTRFRIDCADETTKKLILTWLDQAMSYSFREAFFREFFRTSYIPIFKTLIRYVPRNYRPNKIPQTEDGNVQQVTAAQARATAELVERDEKRMRELVDAFTKLGEVREQHKQGLASQERVEHYERVVAEKQATWQKGFLPGSYTILDPMLVDIEGPKEMAWLRQPYLNVSTDLLSAVRKPTSAQKDVVDRLPPEVVRQILNGSNKIHLPENVCTIVTGEKQPYETYPTPIVSHAFPALRRKKNMQLMDDQTINSITNRILLVKIGNDQWPVFDPNEMTKLKNEFKNAGRTMTLFWNHTIELKWIEPDLKSLTDVKKFDTVNDEIRTVFGVNAVLTGTGANGGSLGNNQMNFKGLQALVASAQGKFCEFVNKEVQLLRMALSLAYDVKVEVDPFNLEDEAKFVAYIMQLYMNGLISHVEAHEELGYDSVVVERNLKKLQKLREKGMFMPTPSANNLGPNGMPNPLQANNKPGGKGGTPTGGKPASQPGGDNNASRTGQPKSTTTAPKLAAAVRVHANRAYLVYEGDQTVAPEQLQDVVSAFGFDDESRFVSASEFKSMTGQDVDFTPAWPQLNPKEVTQSAIAATRLQARMEQATEDKIKSARAGTQGNKRAYITEEQKLEIGQRAIAEVGLAYVKESTNQDGVPDRWDRHFKTVCGDVDTEMAEEPLTYRRALAYTLCLKRSQKIGQRSDTPVSQ